MSDLELFLVFSYEMPKTEFQMEINLIDAKNKWVSNISESLSLIYGALIKSTDYLRGNHLCFSRTWVFKTVKVNWSFIYL